MARASYIYIAIQRKSATIEFLAFTVKHEMAKYFAKHEKQFLKDNFQFYRANDGIYKNPPVDITEEFIDKFFI